MKRNIALVLAMILTLSFCLTVSAADVKNAYAYGDFEIVFEEDSAFSDEMKQHIADYTVNGDDGASTYNLLCTLFGHKEVVECVTTISHKLSPVNPRCLSQTWEVHCCSRCNEALEMILLGEAYITCCPED